MGTRATANLVDRGSAARAGRPADRRARGTVAQVVVAGVVAAGLMWMPLPAHAEASVSPGIDYAAGADVYLVSRTDRGDSGDPAMTPDAQRIAYVSTAPDLADGAPAGFPNVYLASASQGSRDPFSRAPVLVSRPDRSLPQDPADDMSVDPAVSANGRYVAFVSLAANLAPGSAPGDPASIFVRDTVDETTVRIDAGATPNGTSAGPDISDDGRYVVFESDATNLSPGDTNGATDVFVADLDANGDGARGDVAVTRLIPSRSVPGGLSEPAISGDGEWVVVTGSVADPSAAATVATATTNVFRVARRTAASALVLPSASAGAVDASGRVVAARADDCGGAPSVVAAVLDESGAWNVVGVGASTGVGDSSQVVSADGSAVAWAGEPATDDGTQEDDGARDPVVRVATPRWAEAVPVGEGCPADAADVTVVGPGQAPALSASGRTVALAGPGDMSAADRSVTAVDLHTHEGLSVTNAMRGAPVPGYLSAADVADVPVEALLGQADELARLPLARVPVASLTGHGPALADLPLDRLALGTAVLSGLALNRPDLPGGWHAILPETPFADDLAAQVSLNDVVEWAASVGESSGSAAEADAAAAVRSIRLGDLVPAGPVGTLSLASLLLGAVPLTELPIGGADDPLDGWRAAASQQRVALEITDATVLAEADAAGLDLGAVGLEEAALPDAVAPEVTGAADDTVGAALLALVPRGDYPWEAFDPAILPADATTAEAADGACADAACGRTARFRFTFDPGPGESIRFADAAASVRLPAETAPVAILVGESGPEASTPDAAYDGTVERDGSVVRLPLGDAVGGTTRSVAIAYTESRGLGAWSTSATLTAAGLVARDAPQPTEPATDAPPAAGATITAVAPAAAPELFETSVRYGVVGGADALAKAGVGGAAPEQWFRVQPPPAGQRLVVSARSADEPLAVTLFEPASGTTPLGVPVRRDSAPRAIPGDGTVAVRSGFGSHVEGFDVVDHVESTAGETAAVAARWPAVDGSGTWLVRVSTARDGAGLGYFGIHADYRAERTAARCTPWTAPVPTPEIGVDPLDPFGTLDPFGPVDPFGTTDPFGLADPLDPLGGLGTEPPTLPTSDAVTISTNTVFVTDFARIRDLHGQDGVDEVLTSIRQLDGTGTVGAKGKVSGAVLTVNGDPAVAAARATLDADPCSVAARQSLVSAINTYVRSAIGAERAHIAAIVLVGGDDVIPHGVVEQHTDTLTEAGDAGALRLAEAAAGTCTAAAAGQVDPCATPLSEAAAAGFVMTDDPYALPDAYPSLGGHLYVPTVAIGRLVDTPDEIRAQLDRFRLSAGVLDADSLFAAGYGAWSDLPEALSAALSWRTGGADELLESGWTSEDAEAGLAPDAAASVSPEPTDAPGIVALNALGDERRMLAEDGSAVHADDHRPSPPPPADAVFDPSGPTEPLEGSLVLSLGCRSGIDLPDSVYGDEAHWVDSFAVAGGFIGSTGCGLADGATLALSERLLAQYADWIGVSEERGPVSAGAALMFAKQAYLAGAAQYTGFDEKVLAQTIFYGVPLYVFADSSKTPPRAQPWADAADAQADGSVTVTLNPSLATVTRTGAEGDARVFLTADGGEPLSAAGQAVLPSVARVVPSTDASGAAARGVLITGLTSRWSKQIAPAVGVPQSGSGAAGPAASAPPSPAVLATLTRQLGPDGVSTVVVATPARLTPQGPGSARFELYDELEFEVLYGDTADTLAPVIGEVDAGDEFRVTAKDPSPSGAVARAVLLVQPDGEAEWQAVELRSADGAEWSGELPDGVGAGYRWLLQVVDEAGNVTATSSDTRR